MIDDFAKEYLHGDLRDVRATMLGKLDGLTEFDARRPLTTTGTNLLGLIKHLSITEAWYFGEVFARPFAERLPWWGHDAERFADLWAKADASRAEIVDRYARVCQHSDQTIGALDIDAPGHVPWWSRPNVKLFNILVHVHTETSRHTGHADILRDQLDATVGPHNGSTVSRASMRRFGRLTAPSSRRSRTLPNYSPPRSPGHVPTEQHRP